MELSEAIRRGAKLHPQHFGELAVWDGHDPATVRATCALGAAMMAARGYPAPVVARISPLLRKRMRCPACRHWRAGERQAMAVVLTHLNDDHKWSRLHIAQWVRSLEDK